MGAPRESTNKKQFMGESTASFYETPMMHINSDHLSSKKPMIRQSSARKYKICKSTAQNHLQKLMCVECLQALPETDHFF